MSLFGAGRLRPAILRVFGIMHARGFHPAVFVGLVMMPAVVAVGYATDRAGPSAPPDSIAPVPLRGTFGAWPAAPANSTPAAGVLHSSGETTRPGVPRHAPS